MKVRRGGRGCGGAYRRLSTMTVARWSSISRTTSYVYLRVRPRCSRYIIYRKRCIPEFSFAPPRFERRPAFAVKKPTPAAAALRRGTAGKSFPGSVNAITPLGAKCNIISCNSRDSREDSFCSFVRPEGSSESGDVVDEGRKTEEKRRISERMDAVIKRRGQRDSVRGTGVAGHRSRTVILIFILIVPKIYVSFFLFLFFFTLESRTNLYSLRVAGRLFTLLSLSLYTALSFSDGFINRFRERETRTRPRMSEHASHTFLISHPDFPVPLPLVLFNQHFSFVGIRGFVKRRFTAELYYSLEFNVSTCSLSRATKQRCAAETCGDLEHSDRESCAPF